MRADDDQAARLGGRVAGVGLWAGERRTDLLADAGAHERRAHAVQELLAAAFGFLQAQGQGAQVVLGDDVGHDRGGVEGRSMASAMARADAAGSPPGTDPPARMMSRSSTITESAGKRPRDFSST